MATTTPRKATPSKAAKAAPAKIAQATPAKAAKAAPAVAKASQPTPHTDRIGVALPKPNAGYTVRWPHASYDLAKRSEGTTGPAWLVLCNAHGTTTGADSAKEGDALGGKLGRPAWCKACAASK
jgi:hypothetical protein